MLGPGQNGNETIIWFGWADLADDVGEGAGDGCNLNQPLPWAMPDGPWLAALDRALAAVRAFAPRALVVFLGFDAGEHDAVATFRITGKGFAEAGRRLASLRCPTLLVQEGGSLSPSLGGYLRSFLRAFEGRT